MRKKRRKKKGRERKKKITPSHPFLIRYCLRVGEGSHINDPTALCSTAEDSFPN